MLKINLQYRQTLIEILNERKVLTKILSNSDNFLILILLFKGNEINIILLPIMKKKISNHKFFGRVRTFICLFIPTFLMTSFT